MTNLLEVKSLPTTGDYGFVGGRDNFREFCRQIFRTNEPRFLQNSQGQLVVFRHADLQLFGTAHEVGNVPAGKTYPARFSNNQGAGRLPGWDVGEVMSRQVFTHNAALHGLGRKILTGWLGPKQVSQMEGLARATAREVLVRVKGGEEINFVEDFAETVVVRFWSSLLHLDADEAVAIGRCTRDMTRLFQVNRTVADLEVLDPAFAEYARLLDLGGRRALEAGDPAITEIAAKLAALDFPDDPHEVGLPPKTVGEFLAGNLIDGFHTAALAAANTFYSLMRNPEALVEVNNAPEKLPRAIAESLRLEAPVLFLNRYVLRDFHFDGLLLPQGNIVTMIWAAGNHDPSVFPDPERFDLNRPHAGLTTFGSGIHICPGRYVGVMLTRVLLEEFADARVEFEQGQAQGEWIPDHKMGQLKSLPIKLARA